MSGKWPLQRPARAGILLERRESSFLKHLPCWPASHAAWKQATCSFASLFLICIGSQVSYMPGRLCALFLALRIHTVQYGEGDIEQSVQRAPGLQRKVGLAVVLMTMK